LKLKAKSKWEFRNNRLKEIDTAFEWNMTPSEFRELPYEDRVEMMAYLDATRKMKQYEDEILSARSEATAKQNRKG